MTCQQWRGVRGLCYCEVTLNFHQFSARTATPFRYISPPGCPVVPRLRPGREAKKGLFLACYSQEMLNETKDDAGRRRPDDPVGLVPLETVSALRRDIPVIPVLVHGGRMPRSEQPPEDPRTWLIATPVELGGIPTFKC